MTEPVLPPSAPDEADGVDETAERGSGGVLKPPPAVRRRLGGRPARWAVAGAAAVVVLGGTVVVTAAVVRHGGERFGVEAVPVGPDGIANLKRMVAGVPDVPGAVAMKGGQAVRVGEPGTAVGLAPEPLPSLPADQAALKAAAAVAGGKVESLEVVPEQGGGSAWQTTVIGTDGVRHLVTVDGTSGTVTGNTAIGG